LRPPANSSRDCSSEFAAGFTLFEVLAALVVLGLLLVGLVQGTRFGLLASEQQNRLIERDADLDAAYRTLRNLIEHARPGSEWEPLVFAGSAHAAVFTSVVPLPTAGSSTLRADVKLVVDTAQRLVLLWTPHLHAIRTVPAPPVVATPILQGVARLDLNYWPARGGGWTSAWQDAAPPRLVRIRIIFADDARQNWPELVAAPMLAAP
jgi:general secretion pathway protein J